MGGFSQLPAYQPSGNPILDELRTKPPDQWSPMAQQAHAMSGAPLPMPNTSLMAPPPQAPSMGTAPMRTLAPTQPQAAPPSMPAVASQPAAQPPSGLQRAQGKQTGLQSSPAGVDKLSLPARIPLRILDTIGQIFAPRIESLIPGTEGHHQQLLRQSGAQVEQEEKQATEEANRQHVGAQAGLATAQAGAIPSEVALRGAQINRENAQAAAAAAKPTDEWAELKEPVTDPDHPDLGAQSAFFNKNDPSQGLRYGNAPMAAKPTDKAASVHYEKLEDGSVAAFTAEKDGSISKRIVAKVDPKIKTEVRPIQVGGKPHQILFNAETGEQIKDLGESGEKSPTVNVGQQDFESQKTGRALLDKAEGAYRGAVQSAQSLASFVDAANSGNKVAAQAIPLEGALTVTTAQGVHRINRNEIEQLQGAGSLFDTIMGKVGKLTKGQPIPPDVLKDFDALSQMMKKQAYSTYKDAHSSAVKRYGLKNEEPLPESASGAEPTDQSGGAVEQWTRNASGQLVKK